MTNLQSLFLEGNLIVDISTLSELTNLLELNLESNRIEDISPLLDCLNYGSEVILYNNPLDETAPDIIAELISRGVNVLY